MIFHFPKKELSEFSIPTKLHANHTWNRNRFHKFNNNSTYLIAMCDRMVECSRNDNFSPLFRICQKMWFYVFKKLISRICQYTSIHICMLAHWCLARVRMCLHTFVYVLERRTCSRHIERVCFLFEERTLHALTLFKCQIYSETKWKIVIDHNILLQLHSRFMRTNHFHRNIGG